MRQNPPVSIGSISGGNTQGRALARAVSVGVSQASSAVPGGERIRIDTLRIEAAQSVNSRQLTEAVRAALARRFSTKRGAS